MAFATTVDAIAFLEQAITRPPDTYNLLPARLRQIARYPYMDALMGELGHPESALRVAHIAGTSGKGSTATMIHAIARAAGIHTGLYTSPYLTVPQERIQIDDAFIADDLFITCTSDVASALDRLKRRFPDFEPHLKMMWVAVMLLAFARAKVDLAVIEVGKGGLYDETNIVQPATSTLVSIGFDHMLSLGDTLPEIAFHKAGIIKAGAPVVSGVRLPEPQQIIEAQARLAGVPIVTIGKEFDYNTVQLTRQGTRFQYHDEVGGDITNCQVSLIGPHYGHNATLAIRTIRTLIPTISDAVISKGLGKAWLPGRFEIAGHNPLIILDVAHNPDKMQAMTETIRAIYPERHPWIVLGTMENKDTIHMLKELQQLHPSGIICTEASVKNRAVTKADSLANEAALLGFTCEVIRNPQMAVMRAIQLSGNEGMVLVTGSVYLISQIREKIVKGMT